MAVFVALATASRYAKSDDSYAFPQLRQQSQLPQRQLRKRQTAPHFACMKYN